MAWKIHTGPFPFVVPDFGGELWNWRITDGNHYTSVTVTFGRELREASLGGLAAHVRKAIETRGRSSVEVCLPWSEPPREIAYTDPSAQPDYWGGKK